MNSSGTNPTGRGPQPPQRVSRDWFKFDNILFAVTVLSSLIALVYYVIGRRQIPNEADRVRRGLNRPSTRP
jgi:hypothetical protein